MRPPSRAYCSAILHIRRESVNRKGVTLFFLEQLLEAGRALEGGEPGRMEATLAAAADGVAPAASGGDRGGGADEPADQERACTSAPVVSVHGTSLSEATGWFVLARGARGRMVRQKPSAKPGRRAGAAAHRAYASGVVATTDTADWLTAVGTVAAVVVAVFLQAWISWRARGRRPKLSLSFDRFAYAWERQLDATEIRYLRLAVTNARGKHAAEEVEVLVLKIDGGPRGSGVVDRWFTNAALRWPNLRLADPPRVTVSPDATRYVDVGCWRQSSENQLPRFLFELALDMKPHSEKHLLEPGEYKIEMAVVPRNADSTRWIVTLSFESAADDNLQPRTPQWSVSRAAD